LRKTPVSRATLLLPVAFACLVYGQIRSGTITGSVKDASGSAVASAAVSIVNQDSERAGICHLKGNWT